MNKKTTIYAAVLAALGIAFGAFGAHGLKNMVSLEAVAAFETGVKYQMYHALALLIIGLSTVLPDKLKKQVTLFFLLGTLCFSGSIYLLSLNEVLSFNTAKIGFVTPMGGILFIIGWILLVYKIVNLKKG